MKEEMYINGQGSMVSLASKTYSATNNIDFVKFSSKGLSKNAVSNVHQTMLNVLNTKESSGGCNRGILYVPGKNAYTYECYRAAFSYLYCKRELQPDGITTKCLKGSFSQFDRCKSEGLE